VADGAPSPSRTVLEDALLGTRLVEAHRLLPGAALAAAVVVAATFGAEALGRAFGAAEGRSPVPAATVAVLLGLVVANTLGVAPPFRPGLDFCVRKVLRLGIVLVGVRLSLAEVLGKGGAAIPAVAASVAAGIAVALLLARRLGVSSRLGILAAASTAICGVTAALAVAPVVDAEEREVAYTVACVTLYGLLGMLLYPFAAHALFGGDPAAAGLFLGTSIHETAQVTGAALAYRESFGAPAAFDAAVVTKLVRNSSLVAVVPVLGWLHARGAAAGRRGAPLARLFPLFVLGFLAMSILRTAGDAGASGGGSAFGLLAAADWNALVGRLVGAATEVCLPAAMAALGLGIRLSSLRDLGPRPLLLGAGAAVAVGLVALAAAAIAMRV
jgi:uncharacterized integral membrane protein (TIGR00698 family)